MIDFTKRPPGWFWVVTALFFIWSLIGCAMYLAEHMMAQQPYIDAFGADKWDLKAITPAWATAGYAVGVWSGLIGGLLLLMRKRLCLPFFYASFIGAIVGFLPSIIDGRFRAVMATGDYGMLVFVWGVCIFIIWFAGRMNRQSYLR